MSQLYSTNSFKIVKRDQVDIIVIETHSNDLCKSYSIYHHTLDNKRIET